MASSNVFPECVPWATNASAKRGRRSRWRLSPEESNYSPLRMAEQCHVSLRHLERRFKLEVGFTPRVWLKRQRLKTALVRLQGTASIKEIAYGLRYCQVSHFCRDFKLQFKMTPSEFRRLPRAALPARRSDTLQDQVVQVEIGDRFAVWTTNT